MATVLRAELSEKNKYYIDKHRFYELKHFCLQYLNWKKQYNSICELSASNLEGIKTGSFHSDLTSKYAIEKAYYSKLMKIVEKSAIEADEDLYLYIIKGVTEGFSYTRLKTQLNIPCSKDTYYDRYRKFFWLLNDYRD